MRILKLISLCLVVHGVLSCYGHLTDWMLPVSYGTNEPTVWLTSVSYTIVGLTLLVMLYMQDTDHKHVLISTTSTMLLMALWVSVNNGVLLTKYIGKDNAQAVADMVPSIGSTLTLIMIAAAGYFYLFNGKMCVYRRACGAGVIVVSLLALIGHLTRTPWMQFDFQPTPDWSVPMPLPSAVMSIMAGIVLLLLPKHDPVAVR